MCSEKKEPNGRDSPSIAPRVVYILVIILLFVITIKCWLWDFNWHSWQILSTVAKSCSNHLESYPQPLGKAAPKREKQGYSIVLMISRLWKLNLIGSNTRNALKYIPQNFPLSIRILGWSLTRGTTIAAHNRLLLGYSETFWEVMCFNRPIHANLKCHHVRKNWRGKCTGCVKGPRTFLYRFCRRLCSMTLGRILRLIYRENPQCPQCILKGVGHRH